MSSENPGIREVYEDVEFVKKKVTELAITKQDKVKPVVVLTLLIFLFSQTLAGAWWASKLNNTVNNIGVAVTELKHGTSTKETTDLQLQILRIQIEKNQINLEQLRSQVKENERNINASNVFRTPKGK